MILIRTATARSSRLSPLTFSSSTPPFASFDLHLRQPPLGLLLIKETTPECWPHKNRVPPQE